MKSVYRAALLAVVVALACAPAAVAQPDKPWKAWFPHIAAQYSMPQGDAADALDDGWGLAGGVTYKPENWKIGIPIELGYTDMDIDQQWLDMIGEPDGNTSGSVMIWNLTGGGMWQTNTAGPVDFYVNANIGVYYTDVELRTPAGWGWVPGGCSWYWCWPGMAVPVDAVRSEDSWDIGGNVGIGLAFALNNDSQIYLEVKYQYSEAGEDGTEWLPIQVGYRW